SVLSGSVTDPGGAVVPGATITVLNPGTGRTLTSVTNERGEWTLPAMLNGTYRVTAAKQGFKTAVMNNVKIDAGVPATVNMVLEIGTLAEVIEVSAGADLLQTATATVTSTLVGRQIDELPFTTRNILELVVTQVGTQTVGTPRTSSINGLPKGSMN